MASFTSFVERVAAATGLRAIEETVSRRLSGDEFAVRPLPNEEIYLWVRAVDNSQVIPQANPQQAGICWKMIGSACLMVMLLVGVLLPVAYNRIAGYQINVLETEREGLLRERSELELREAELVGPARLAELARLQQLVDPAPDTAVTLSPVPDGALARNNSR